MGHGQNDLGLVLGRKITTARAPGGGTEVAALFYSLIESAKLCGVEPQQYLLRSTRAALVDRTAVMLPRDLLASP